MTVNPGGMHGDDFLDVSDVLQKRQWHPTPVLLPRKSHGQRSLVGCSPPFHFSLSCLEKEMATHSSVLAWRDPGTGEPDGLPSVGSHRVGHDWSDLAVVAAAMCNNPTTQYRFSSQIIISRTILFSRIRFPIFKCMRCCSKFFSEEEKTTSWSLTRIMNYNH